jgi:hypothetical protein
MATRQSDQAARSHIIKTWERTQDQGAVTLTTRARGVYNLISVGGAFLFQHRCTVQTARIEIAAE